MIFTIITQVPHIKFENNYFSYEPYIREMKIWEKYITKLVIIAPLCNEKIQAIHDKYNHVNIEFIELKLLTHYIFYLGLKISNQAIFPLRMHVVIILRFLLIVSM